MNKHNSLSILNILFLLAIVLSSGCGQSTHIDSSTSTVVSSNTLQSSQTPTPISCVSLSQTPTSDIEKKADDWFLSSISQISGRDQYSNSKDWANSWETICSHYQTAISNNESWVHNPIDVALKTFTFSEFFIPDNVIALTMPERKTTTFQNQASETYVEHNAIVVVYSILHPDQDLEIRVDLIREDEIWKIRWIGSRWKCYKNTNVNWSTEPCS